MLATLYKDGRGVEKNEAEAARLLAAAALAGENPDAEVEYAIALYNGTGVTKDEVRATVAVPPRRPARQPDRPEPAGAHFTIGRVSPPPVRSRRSNGT